MMETDEYAINMYAYTYIMNAYIVDCNKKRLFVLATLSIFLYTGIKTKPLIQSW